MKWEYRSIKMEAHGVLGGNLDVGSFDQLLNVQGAEGWELVSTMDTNLVEGATRYVVAVFKRQAK